MVSVAVFVFLAGVSLSFGSKNVPISECRQTVGNDHLFHRRYRVAEDQRLLFQDQMISCDGYVTAWKTFVPDSSCRLVAEVWRPVDRETVFLSATTHWTETVYHLVGETFLVPSRSKSVSRILGKEEHLAVKAGDVIGVRMLKPASSKASGCLRYTRDISKRPSARVCQLLGDGVSSSAVRCNVMRERALNFTFSATIQRKSNDSKDTKTRPTQEIKFRATDELRSATTLPGVTGQKKEDADRFSRILKKVKGLFSRETDLNRPTTPPGFEISTPSSSGTLNSRSNKSYILWAVAVVGIGSALCVSLCLVSFYALHRRNRQQEDGDCVKPQSYLKDEKVTILDATP